MNVESKHLVGRWSDTRELIERIRRLDVHPYVDDVFVKILPGLVLLLGFLVVTQGVSFAYDFVSAFWGWLLLLLVLTFAWLLGAALLKISRKLRYARPLHPGGWDKYLWLEALDDFEDRAPLGLRRTASRFRILAHASIGVGAALGTLVLVLYLYAAPCLRWLPLLGWTIVALLAMLALRIIHSVFRRKWHEVVLGVVSQESVTTSGKATPIYLGPQEFAEHDRQGSESRYSEVREAVFANPYYSVWGAGGQPLPIYRVTLRSVLRGILPFGLKYQFREAAKRTVDSKADMRWGPDGRGYRRLLHPNGICLFGKWEITEESGYSGYFQKGSEALVIARYSTCCTETRRGRRRSLSLVGKLYPTTDPHHAEPLPTANFITQQNLGGETNFSINEAEFRNAPDTTAWRRGLGPNGLPVILLTGIVFKIVDRTPAERQLYEIAELGKAPDAPTNTPRFMRILVDEAQPIIKGEHWDFRDEILAQIYNRYDRVPQRELVFPIEVADQGTVRGPALLQRREIKDWRRIGRLVFKEAVASYNGDFVIHFHHPGWREDRNDPTTALRP